MSEELPRLFGLGKTNKDFTSRDMMQRSHINNQS